MEHDHLLRASIHELGHAYAYLDCGLLPGPPPWKLKIYISPTGRGYVEGTHYTSPAQRIISLLAGNLAEQMLCGEGDGFRGDAGDLEKVRAIRLENNISDDEVVRSLRRIAQRIIKSRGAAILRLANQIDRPGHWTFTVHR